MLCPGRYGSDFVGMRAKSLFRNFSPARRCVKISEVAWDGSADELFPCHLCRREDDRFTHSNTYLIDDARFFEKRVQNKASRRVSTAQ